VNGYGLGGAGKEACKGGQGGGRPKVE